MVSIFTDVPAIEFRSLLLELLVELLRTAINGLLQQ